MDSFETLETLKEFKVPAVFVGLSDDVWLFYNTATKQSIEIPVSANKEDIKEIINDIN